MRQSIAGKKTHEFSSLNGKLSTAAISFYNAFKYKPHRRAYIMAL